MGCFWWHTTYTSPYLQEKKQTKVNKCQCLGANYFHTVLLFVRLNFHPCFFNVLIPGSIRFMRWKRISYYVSTRCTCPPLSHIHGLTVELVERQHDNFYSASKFEFSPQSRSNPRVWQILYRTERRPGSWRGRQDIVPHYFALRSLLFLGVKTTDYGQTKWKSTDISQSLMCLHCFWVWMFEWKESDTVVWRGGLYRAEGKDWFLINKLVAN